MKSIFLLLAGISMIALFSSCEKLLGKEEDSGTIGGAQSAMGEVGVTVSSSSVEIAGVSNCEATITSLTDGISSYTAEATVTNPLLKNIVSNFPGVTIDGDKCTITNFQVQQTTEGIKTLTGPGAGVIVKYDSEVGDTYPVGNTGSVRKVVSKTGEDDYSYGFMLIKTIQVEMEPLGLKKTGGITKYTYIANHKFGLVGVKVSFDDGTSATFPVYSSTQN